jgi:hypothetical protein
MLLLCVIYTKHKLNIIMVIIVVPGNTADYINGILGVKFVDEHPYIYTTYVTNNPEQFIRVLNQIIATTRSATSLDSIICFYWVVDDERTWNLIEAPDLYTSPLCESSPFL